MPLGTGDQGPEPGVADGGIVVAGEEPVLSADGYSLEGALGGIVVDVQKALFGVAVERFPLVKRVADRLGHGTSGQHSFLFRVEPLFDLRQDRLASRLASLTDDLVIASERSSPPLRIKCSDLYPAFV